MRSARTRRPGSIQRWRWLLVGVCAAGAGWRLVERFDDALYDWGDGDD